jgi:hypothetical protein
MPLAPDDDVIVHGHAQQPPGLGDALGDLDVGAAGLRIAAGVVVDQDQALAPRSIARRITSRGWIAASSIEPSPT